MCDFIIDYQGQIPGASAQECGNYLEQNLPMAKYYIKKYKEQLIKFKDLDIKGLISVLFNIINIVNSFIKNLSNSNSKILLLI